MIDQLQSIYFLLKIPNKESVFYDVITSDSHQAWDEFA